jgi:hypothetical protein
MRHVCFSLSILGAFSSRIVCFGTEIVNRICKIMGLVKMPDAAAISPQKTAKPPLNVNEFALAKDEGTGIYRNDC